MARIHTDYTRRYPVTYKGKRFDLDGTNTLEASVHYNKGGINYFTCRDEKRGYYFSLQPVEVTGCGTKFAAFTGVKCLMFEVKRNSKGAFERAKAAMDEYLDAYMADFMTENDLVSDGDGFKERED